MIGAAILSAASVAFVAASVATPPDTIHFDCTAHAYSNGDGSAPRALNDMERAKFGLPFELETTSMDAGAGIEMRIVWNGDPFRLAGGHSARWSNEGQAWLMNGLGCEDGPDPCASFVILNPIKNGEAQLTILRHWDTKDHPQPRVGDEFNATCKPSGKLK